MPEILVLDSCVLIDLIQGIKSVSSHIDPLIEKSKRAEVLLVFSSASRAEIMYLKEMAAKGLSQHEQTDLICGWLNQDYLTERLVDREIGDTAAELRRHVGTRMEKKILTPIDSIVLATAKSVSASVLVTNDNGSGGKKDGNGNRPVGMLELDGFFGPEFPRIRKPENIPGQSDFSYEPKS